MPTRDKQYLRSSRMLRSNTITNELRKPRVGPAYQAVIPDFETKRHRGIYETVTWAPCGNNSDKELNSYINGATKITKLTIDQALSFLYYHNGNIKEAVENMEKFSNINEGIIEPQHEKYMEVPNIPGKRIVPDDYELDKGYMRTIKNAPQISLMELKQKIYETNEWETEDQDSYLYSDMELLQLYQDHKHANIELLSKHRDHKFSIADNDRIKIENTTVDSEAEFKLVAGTPIDKVLKIELQSNWTKEDEVLLSFARKDFNNDYESIAAIIGTKTADQVFEYCMHF